MKVRSWKWVTSWPVLGLWIMVSMSVTVASLGALFTPAWFIRDNGLPNFHQQSSLSNPVPEYTSTTFGIWSWCIESEYVTCAPVGENFVGGGLEASSVIWAMVGVIYGGGTVVIGITSAAGGLILLFSSPHTKPAFIKITSKIQFAAVFLQVFGLVMYPIGLDSSFVRSVCGQSASSYSSGSCSIGYAYMLALSSTALALYCPILARLIIYKNYEDSSLKLNIL